jgi:hypothetical protein
MPLQGAAPAEAIGRTLDEPLHDRIARENGSVSAHTLSVVFAALLLAPLAARAVPVRLDFAGTIDLVYDDGISDGSAVVGGSFSGSVLLDTDAAPNDTSIGQARYFFGSPPYAFSATFGDYEVVVGPLDPEDPVSPDAFQVNVADGTGDVVGISAVAIFVSDAVPPNLDLRCCDFALTLWGTPLSSTALNEVPWDLASWETEASFNFGLEDLDGSLFQVHGTVDSLTATFIPEPGTLALVGAGFLALASRRSRSRSRI